MARASVCLIIVALIAGMVGCAPAQYDLTISSTEGGQVITPGEGEFTYDEGTVVNLVAEADEGYRFVDWTGYVSAIADVTAAATNITMNHSYSTTANFALDICLEIRDWYDLDDIKDNLFGSYILMNDLDSTTPGYEELASPTANGGRGWWPIGAGKYLFKGIFNGQGYEICDLFIYHPKEGGGGLFGSVGEAGVIKDIGVVNVTVVTGDSCVGGLVGYNRGTVSNCYSTGNVTGEEGTGGLVGENYGTVSNSSSSANVIGEYVVGGLVGGNEHEWKSIEGTVINSYSTGSVSGENYVGGLVGINFGPVSDSYSSGNVTGDEDVGGLAGYSAGIVSNSYSIGSVTGYKHVGGLVGDNNGSVSNSFYNYDEVLIKGENIITVGALFGEDFDQWLANDKFLDVNERLSQEDGYYVINDVTDFKELLTFGQDGSLKFRLKNDLDLSDEPNFYIPYLVGEFDGNGHKISNLSLDSYLVSPLGLFGCLVSGGKITQVGVENINISGTSSVGGLVGKNGHGIVSNSYSTGSVNGNHLVGGLVGSNWGTVSNSYSIGSVTGEDDVGGVAGSNVGDVISSYSIGSVTGDDYVGGLVGGNGGTVSNSYSSGNVTGDGYVGGLVGFNTWGTVNNCYSTGSVTGDGYVGGLVGGNGGTVDNSYSTGNVNGDTYVGGLVGFNIELGIVRNSYSTGSVTGDEHVGGLVGWNDATVRNSYSTGNVSGNVGVGGLVGYSERTVRNSFWDTQTSGQATSDGGTGKTTAEMQDIATFSGAEWDIITVAPSETNDAYTWNIVDKQTYPFLSWES